MTSVAASLIIPSYGGAARLPVLFDALRTQRFDRPWEAVLVLDGVIDDSEAVIATADDLPIRVIRFGRNRGRPAALNAGFAAATGDVLIRCDDDLEPGPSYVADHVLAHEGPDPVGAVGLYRNRFGDTAYARVYGRRYDRSVREGAYLGSLADARYFWAGNCSVTRETFEKVGPYDERFRAYGWEDIDWGFRLADRGVPIVLDPRLETIHHAANVDVATRIRRGHASGAARFHFDYKHGTRYRSRGGSGLRARVWDVLVEAGATRTTPQRLGGAIDRILARVPAGLGFRLVSLAVDAAALAGYRQAATSTAVPVYSPIGGD